MPPRPLDRITIEGYKSIRRMEDFPLHNLNVLIGANGAGKSNFISFFSLLHDLAQGNLQVSVARSGGANALLYLGQKTTQAMHFSLGFGDDGYQFTLAPGSGDELFFTEEEVFQGVNQAEYLGGGQKESLLPATSSTNRKLSIADEVLASIKDWRVYHFHDTSASAGVKRMGALDDNAVLRADASNLAAFLYLLHETREEYYEQIVAAIRLAAPFFDDFSLRPNPLIPQKIQLEWREKGSDAYFNAHMLSDGTLRFMCLATLLLQPSLPSTILIDEPELGLHPYALVLLASLLKGAAERTQVIISTQSASLVNQFGPGDIIVVDRVAGESVFGRRSTDDLESWLDEYGMGDLWEKNLLGGRPE